MRANIRAVHERSPLDSNRRHRDSSTRIGRTTSNRSLGGPTLETLRFRVQDLSIGTLRLSRISTALRNERDLSPLSSAWHRQLSNFIGAGSSSPRQGGSRAERCSPPYWASEAGHVAQNARRSAVDLRDAAMHPRGDLARSIARVADIERSETRNIGTPAISSRLWGGGRRGKEGSLKLRCWPTAIIF